MKSGHYRKYIGRIGETEAVGYLEKKGFVILERNYRAERGEIDIIAREGDTLVFVEVKTKRQDGFGEPEDWVGRKKQDQIAKVAMRYLQEKNLDNVDCRFDVIAIGYENGKKKISHIQDAFWLNEQEERLH